MRKFEDVTNIKKTWTSLKIKKRPDGNFWVENENMFWELAKENAW